MGGKLLAVVTYTGTNWKQIGQMPTKIMREYYYQRNQSLVWKILWFFDKEAPKHTQSVGGIGASVEIEVLIMYAI